MKEIIDKLDFIKIKNFCSAKDNVKRMRRWNTFHKGLLSKICKELLQLNSKKTTQLKNVLKILTDTSPKENIQMANKHMKRCSTSYIIREMAKWNNNEIPLHTIRMPKIWNAKNTKCWWGCRAIGTLLLVGMQNATASLEDSLAASFKTKYTLPYDPAIMLLGIYTKEMKTCVQKHAHGYFRQLYSESSKFGSNQYVLQ